MTLCDQPATFPRQYANGCKENGVTIWALSRLYIMTLFKGNEHLPVMLHLYRIFFFDYNHMSYLAQVVVGTWHVILHYYYLSVPYSHTRCMNGGVYGKKRTGPCSLIT